MEAKEILKWTFTICCCVLCVFGTGAIIFMLASLIKEEAAHENRPTVFHFGKDGFYKPGNAPIPPAPPAPKK